MIYNLSEFSINNYKNNKLSKYENFLSSIQSPTKVIYLRPVEKTFRTTAISMLNIFNSNILAFEICITGYCGDTLDIGDIKSSFKIEKILNKYFDNKKAMSGQRNEVTAFYEKNKNNREYVTLFSNYFNEYTNKYKIAYLILSDKIENEPLLSMVAKNFTLVDESLIKGSKRTRQQFYLYKKI